MMQTTPHTWADVFFQVATILGSGLIALVGTWIALHHQRKLKEREIQSETDFKARELIFDIRRKKYDRSNEEAGTTMKSLGELLIKINFIAYDKKREAVLPTLQLFQRGLLELAISPAPVQAEGLQFMYQLCSEERATFIKETLQIDLEKLPIQEYVGLLWRYAEIFNELEGIRVGLLEGICHETFDDFLPESLKSTQPPKLSPTNNQAAQHQK